MPAITIDTISDANAYDAQEFVEKFVEWERDHPKSAKRWKMEFITDPSAFGIQMECDEYPALMVERTTRGTYIVFEQAQRNGQFETARTFKRAMRKAIKWLKYIKRRDRDTTARAQRAIRKQLAVEAKRTNFEKKKAA